MRRACMPRKGEEGWIQSQPRGSIFQVFFFLPQPQGNITQLALDEPRVWEDTCCEAEGAICQPYCGCMDSTIMNQEVKRVLRPGGFYLYLNHVAAKDGTLLSDLFKMFSIPCNS